MAICVELSDLTADLSGSVGSTGPVIGGQGITLSAQSLQDCSGYIMLTASDYTQLMSEPTLMDIFTIPVVGDLQQMWMLGFSLPIITYLSSWGFGVVINWFKEKH